MSAKILIIDDEPDVCIYLKTLLEDNHYCTVSASSSKEGLESVINEHPDLICLDIMMPKESGISLYKKLRSNEEFGQIPVLLISAISREKDFELGDIALDPGLPQPVGYLEKPISPKMLLEKIKSILG